MIEIPDKEYQELQSRLKELDAAIAECKRAERQINDDKLLLYQKNLALTELLEYIERTKIKTKEDITINIERVLMPTLKKLEATGVPLKYVKLLEHQLNELASAFGRKITDNRSHLSRREIEICELIKDGLTSKETSDLLHISYTTVDKHRRNIRKKLGISNKKSNLASFLTAL